MREIMKDFKNMDEVMKEERKKKLEEAILINSKDSKNP